MRKEWIFSDLDGACILQQVCKALLICAGIPLSDLIASMQGLTATKSQVTDFPRSKIPIRYYHHLTDLTNLEVLQIFGQTSISDLSPRGKVNDKLRMVAIYVEQPEYLIYRRLARAEQI